MKWVTRKRIHVNRTATAWLIRRFLDPAAEILFVEPDQVATVQESENAIGFDAPGARYPHRDERRRCSFEQLVDEHFPRDAALQTGGASLKVWRVEFSRPTEGRIFAWLRDGAGPGA
jgi:hypothetical protein